ncbi:MAG: glycosyltransferase family 4 protein [Patescibacteria group bacterium]
MRIAMIGQKGIPCTGGGVERHVEELSRHLVKAGHEVVVYTRPYYTDPKRNRYYGVSLVSLPSIPTKHCDAITHSFLCTLDAMRRGVDIIHYHGIGPSLCSFLPRILTPHIKVVGTFHSQDWRHQKWGFLARLILHLGAWAMIHVPHITIAVSQEISDLIFKRSGRRVPYIPTGITLHKKKPPVRHLKPFALRQGNYLLLVSRFVRHKSIADAVEAFIRLKTRFPNNARVKKLKLALVGGGAFTDEYVQEIKNLIGARNDIVLTGYQKGHTLHALYAHAYAFLQPSISEGKSIALLEAMSWGLPIIAADIPETREVLNPPSHNISGILYLPHDIPKFTHAISTLIKKPWFARQVGAQARREAVLSYDWKSIIYDIIALYECALQESNEFLELDYRLKEALKEAPGRPFGH